MRDVMTLALKDVKIFRRDGARLFWVIGFPLVVSSMDTSTAPSHRCNYRYSA